MSYLITRRCLHRELLLKPTPSTNAVFKFVLAVAAKRYGILLHGACVLSNHYHLVLTDPGAQLPRFSQFLDGLVARAINASYGRWETFWAPSSYSAVSLVSGEDVIEKVAYTLANPVAAGLVRTGSEWPGIWSDPIRIGSGEEIVGRPQEFFSKVGSMPEMETLAFTIPPCLPLVGAFRAEVLARVKVLETEAAMKLEAKGMRFAGVRRILRQKHTTRPATGEPRRTLNPRIAARDRWKRVEALGRLVGFLRDYRAALARFRKREIGVLFPRGTFLMRVHFGVACASG